MKTPVSLCPVPSEQQPVNEYQSLKESWFYGWATRNLRGFLTPIVVLWSVGGLIAAPIAAVSFPPEKLLLRFSLSTLIGAVVLPALALVQLYLGWGYVANRLSQETIPYEESGWYDGQTWTKPNEVLARDRLIVSYELEPLFRRLRRTFGSLALFLAVGGILWNLV
jgi:hypothetical protein